jgi:glycosyltransferase involved in cell wall biosynthesis
MAKTIALYLASMRKGGAERVIANLADYFCRVGFRVVLVTTRLAEEEYEVPEGVVRRISEPSAEELAGGRVSNFRKRFMALRTIWKEEKPDVILSFIGKNNMMAILTSRGLKIPVAVSVRGEPAEEYYSTWLRFLAKNLFRFADRVILQTNRCMAFFPPAVRKKSVILKNPINPSFFRERYEGNRENTIVAVGRVDENKNHEMLIRAFAELAEEFPAYRLIIYGEGEKRKDLQKLAEEMQLSERILLPGAVEDVAEHIYKTRVFVLPSNTEGMPNTLIEAMIMGLTVVATDCPCGGPAELIQNGYNGILTPVGDISGMKDSLQFLLNNLQQADEMGINAMKTGDIYRPERVCREWRECLENLMNLK